LIETSLVEAYGSYSYRPDHGGNTQYGQSLLRKPATLSSFSGVWRQEWKYRINPVQGPIDCWQLPLSSCSFLDKQLPPKTRGKPASHPESECSFQNPY
jgi:hypothetical protein